MKSRRWNTGLLLAAVWITLPVLSACGPESSERESATASETGGTADAAQAAAPGPDADYLDILYADSLHPGIEPASPGSAWIEIEGERVEFTKVECNLTDAPGEQRLHVVGSGESTGSGHMLYMERMIGDDIGWSFEDEFVQFARRVPREEDGPAMYGSSMAQHERPRGGAPKWDRGGGASPLIRIVGNEATAIGTLSRMPAAPDPLTGEFIVAATCP